MKMTILLVTFFAVLSSAQARLGETREQCRQRYGDPAEEKTEGGVTWAQYSMKGFSIGIAFINGVAEAILYEKEGERREAAMTADEIKTLLSANAQGSSWTKIDNMRKALDADDLERRDLMRNAMRYDTWRRDDGKAFARYVKMEDKFTVVTKKGIEFLQKDEEKPLKGF